MPRAQVPASPPPPPAQSGPSDFEKTLALADRFAKLSEVKAPSVPPQPANYGDSLVAEVLKVVTGQLGKLGHEPQIKQPTLKDQVESLARIATLMRQTGLTADAVGQIGEAIDDDQVEEEPGPVRSFLLGLAPILSEVARGFGSGFGAEINKSLAPAIAGAVFPSKPNNPQTPATPTQPLPQRGGDVKGPTPVPPPSAPKHIRPFPMPPSAASPAPFQPRQTVKARPGVDQGSATKTEANPSASHPDNPEGRPADLLNANRQPLGVYPGGAQKTVLSDELFGYFLSVLQMDMPPEEVGRILLSQTPEGAGQFFRLPADQAWKVAERYLTPPQQQAAEKMLPRIMEVFHAMQALMGVMNPGN